MSDYASLMNEDATILVVDDINENIQFLGQILKQEGYKISFATNGEQALHVASHLLPDLILLDIMMPGMSGYDVCEALKEIPETKDIPIIFVTAIDQKDDIIKGLRLGAMDYITKPFHAEELLLRVRNHLELARNRKLIIRYLDTLGKEKMELEKVAITDGLTGLFNHSYTMERLQHEVSNAGRYNLPLTLIMFDIDHFKQVNDQYGHQFGDSVLKKLADVLRSNLRDGDLPGRYGGEEFIVILPNTELGGGGAIGERIRTMIEGLTWNEEDFRVTISGGVFQCHNNTAEQMIAETDKLLYLAKEKGRNRLVLPDMS